LVGKTVLVTLSGTHGTGKSTNAGRCYYLLNRSGYRFSYLRQQDILDPFGFIVRRAARILHVRPNDLERTAPMRVLWALYIFFVYSPILVGGIRIRGLLGYSTVCDRYIYDLFVGFRDNGVHVPLETLLRRLVPKADVSFVLDAPEDRILTNRPEHSEDFIRREKWLYGKIAEQLHLKMVATTDPPRVVWKKMFYEIDQVLNGQHFPQQSER
jgi:thymidylate kinase